MLLVVEVHMSLIGRILCARITMHTYNQHSLGEPIKEGNLITCKNCAPGWLFNFPNFRLSAYLRGRLYHCFDLVHSNSQISQISNIVTLMNTAITPSN